MLKNQRISIIPQRPATTFFCPPNEKNLRKTATAKLYLVEKWEAMDKK